MGYERKKSRIKDSEIYSLSTWKDGITMNWNKKELWIEQFKKEYRHLEQRSEHVKFELLDIWMEMYNRQLAM